MYKISGEAVKLAVPLMTTGSKLVSHVQVSKFTTLISTFAV